MQNRGSRIRWSASTFMLAVCIGQIPVAANAQQVQETADAAAPNADGTALEEIIVTAQKRSESLQDTPIAITAISGDALAERGISGLQALGAGAIPSLRWTTFGGRSSAFVIGMRGVVPGDATQISRDNAVGIYVDGAYLGRIQGLGADFLDVERIEVLRGPQGTLFGRNALAGAISITTKAPTGQFGGKLTMGLRNFGGYNLGGTLNLPEVANISVKLDGNWSKRDGWLDNPLPGELGWSSYKRWAGRATALWRPSADFSVRYSYEKSRDESTPTYVQIDSLLPGAPALAPFFTLEPQRATKARGGFRNDPSVGKVEGHTATIDWTPSNAVEVKSISSYRKMSQTQFENFAGTFFPYAPGALFARLSMADIYQDQFSQELQVIGTAQSLKYVVGGYYYTESGRDSAYTPSGARFNADGSGYVNLATPVGSPPPARASKASTESFGLFANLTYTPNILADRLHLTGGLRYSNEHKDGALTFRRGVPLTGITFDFKSERVDPKFDMAFDWNPDVMTYLSWGRGFRAGGANSRSPRFLKFGEETGSTWELGLKSQFLDDRARFNVALWASRYENIQIEFTDPTNPAVLETANANKVAHFKGIEAEFTLVPVPGLTLSSSFAYTDAKIPPQPSPFGGTEIVNVPVVNTPKYAGAITMKWDVVETDWADIKFQADATFSSKLFASLASPRATDGYTLLNMRLGFDNIPLFGNNKGTSISFWAKNITNTEYISGDFTPIAGSGLSNFMISYYNEPRTYGVELTHRF